MFLVDLLDQLWLVRKLKGGIWVKTKQRGWITEATYEEYLDHGFDPDKIK